METPSAPYGIITFLLFCTSLLLSFAVIKQNERADAYITIAAVESARLKVATAKYDSLQNIIANHIDTTCKIIHTIKTTN